LEQLEQQALEAYRSVVYDDRLRRLVSQKVRTEPEKRWQPGERVLYLRDEGKYEGGARHAKWHGPAVVVGEVLHKDPGDEVSRVGYVHVDHGGNLLRVRPVDLQSVNKVVDPEVGRARIGHSPEDVDSQLERRDASSSARDAKERKKELEAVGGEEVGREGDVDAAPPEKEEPREKKAAVDEQQVAEKVEKVRVVEEFKYAASDGSDAEDDPDEVENRPLRRSKRLQRKEGVCMFTEVDEHHKTHQNKTCLLVEGEAFVEQERVGHTYAYKWKDVSVEEQNAADRRAIEDYDKHGCWLRGSERKLPELKKAGETTLPGRYVRRAKVVVDPSTGKKVLKGRSRWTPKGFHEIGEGFESPTVHPVTHRTLDILGKQRDWKTVTGDISEAFFRGKKLPVSKDGLPMKKLWIEVPEGDDAYVPGEKWYRLLLTEVPGTRGAPQNWYMTWDQFMKSIGAERSKIDPCVYYILTADGETAGWLAVHVDDVKGRLSDEVFNWVVEEVKQRFGCELEEKARMEYTGVTYIEHADGVEITQKDYIDEKLEEVPLAPGRWKRKHDYAYPDEVRNYRTSLGGLAWVAGRSRPTEAYEASHQASQTNHLTVGDICRINKTVRYVKKTSSDSLWIPKLPPGKPVVVAITDAGEGELPEDQWPKAQHGRLIGLKVPGDPQQRMGLCDWKSQRCRRVTHSSFDSEAVSGVMTLDSALAIGLLVEEFHNGVRCSMRERIWKGEEEREKTPVELYCDAACVTTRANSLSLDPKMSKRRKQDIADMQECLAEGDVSAIIHVQGEWNIADALTKGKARTTKTMTALREMLKSGVYVPPV